MSPAEHTLLALGFTHFVVLLYLLLTVRVLYAKGLGRRAAARNSPPDRAETLLLGLARRSGPRGVPAHI